MSDNCIEADGGAHNIRVFRNRCFNSAGGSYQRAALLRRPALTSYQNVAYQTTSGGPLKYLDTPAGVLTYQNTFVGQGTMIGPAANIHFLNNLFVGDNWSTPVFSVRTSTNYSTSDYNGFRPEPRGGESLSRGIHRPSKPPPITKGSRSHAGSKRSRNIARQPDRIATASWWITTSSSRWRLPNPADPQRLFNAADFDFRLKPGSAAIDAGMALPTINDGFSGRAPDLGAYELDKPIPHYGPRP